MIFLNTDCVIDPIGVRMIDVGLGGGCEEHPLTAPPAVQTIHQHLYPTVIGLGPGYYIWVHLGCKINSNRLVQFNNEIIVASRI